MTFVNPVVAAPRRGAHSHRGVERGRKMHRQAARRDQHDVEAHVARRVVRMAGEPELRGGDDALLLAPADRFRGIGELLARLDLDEHQHAAPPRHDVDLADRRLEAAREDAIALGDEIGGGAALGRQAEAEREAPLGIGRTRERFADRRLTLRHRPSLA